MPGLVASLERLAQSEEECAELALLKAWLALPTIEQRIPVPGRVGRWQIRVTRECPPEWLDDRLITLTRILGRDPFDVYPHAVEEEDPWAL